MGDAVLHPARDPQIIQAAPLDEVTPLPCSNASATPQVHLLTPASAVRRGSTSAFLTTSCNVGAFGASHSTKAEPRWSEHDVETPITDTPPRMSIRRLSHSTSGEIIYSFDARYDADLAFDVAESADAWP